MKYTHALILLASAVAHGAVHLDGSRAMQPLSDNDPSPIEDILPYIPDQYDCPLPCQVDYANVHKWTPLHSLDRLRRCELPMLLDFSVLRPLDDPKTDVVIRSCTLGADPATAGNRTIINAMSVQIDNPKNGTNLFEARINTAPACAIEGAETDGELELTTGGGRPGASVQDIEGLLDGMKTFFNTKGNCDETFLFAYHKKTIASIYIGAGLGKQTVASALQTVAGRLQAGSDSMGNKTVAQICGGGRGPGTIFGLAIDTTGDIVGVQKTAVSWSRGDCASTEDDIAPPLKQETLDVKVFDIASAPLTTNRGFVNGTINGNSTSPLLARSLQGRTRRSWRSVRSIGKRATCSYIQVMDGDGCASLAVKCGIHGDDFMTYNPDPNFCATLQVGDYVCCSAGDPYVEPKPDPPLPNPDGSCAAHLIGDTDTCESLGKTYGLTVDEIESFNEGKTWGWTECRYMLASYTMCLSTGTPPLPPPQQGVQCGPQVPGTERTDTTTPMTELNPCPLRACCSNWGFCGPFPQHCDINAPPGGGPGTKLPEADSTCISNCGNEIKQNSGPPEVFSRIGYYESWNLGRDCLWQNAENANTDGSYTHMHWGFAEIDPATWTVVITDPHNQWEAFKALPNMKRIVSFGGWAYSTEPATYNIIRQAIITHRETFATNAAQFVIDEGIDGIDIDWEYPGAPDIYVDGEPIGQEGDGEAYLQFLTTLKSKLPSKLVAIAAPASYWYLRAFPIDQIAAVIDYIVYMTYDLHGQWDYGNPNAFDSCDSGKCIRSHVNLTETRNTLSIITKAGVPNNKIFVGEASYGRSFHMAVDGCWGPMCEFTGTRTESDAKPGRCTGEGGYLAHAEINEIIRSGRGQLLHDHESNTDVLLYEGDYVSYMTPLTKDTRRIDWKALNFAGTIDWAVDLQAFGSEDTDKPVELPPVGSEGCVGGESADDNAHALCTFACYYGFCPENTCRCAVTGPVRRLPPVMSSQDFMAYNEFDVDYQRLCKFACKYGFCPKETCGEPVVDEWEDGSVDSDDRPTGGLWDKEKNFNENRWQCMVYKSPKWREASAMQCYETCREIIEEAQEEGRTTNYGCIGFWPLDEPIPWTKWSGDNNNERDYATGRCSCDNGLMNIIADMVIDALPIIAQIGCFIIMSSLKLVLDIGLAAIPGVGKPLDAGLDAVTTAAQLVSYAYPESEDPLGAFEWWLSPCGGSDLVPSELKRAFDILSAVAGGVSSFKEPPNIPKNSGKKGDDANPTDRSKPKAGTGTGKNGTGSGKVTKARACRVPAGKSSTIMGEAKNTLRLQSCVAAGGGSSTTTKKDYVITSLDFGATPTTVSKVCEKQHSQACFHYSSAVAQNPSWEVLPCVHGNVRNPEDKWRPGTDKWSDEHHKSWRDLGVQRAGGACNIDEYPPRYLLSDNSPEMLNPGQPGGQLMRYLPWDENQKAGKMWRSACFAPHIAGMSPAQFLNLWNTSPVSKRDTEVSNGFYSVKTEVSVNVKPYFKISGYEHSSNPPHDSGLWDNPCWPQPQTPNDPGFALFNSDNWYTNKVIPNRPNYAVQY